MPPKRRAGASRGWKCCAPADPPEAVPPGAVVESDDAAEYATNPRDSTEAAQQPPPQPPPQQPPQQPRTPGGHTEEEAATKAKAQVEALERQAADDAKTIENLRVELEFAAEPEAGPVEGAGAASPEPAQAKLVAELREECSGLKRQLAAGAGSASPGTAFDANFLETRAAALQDKLQAKEQELADSLGFNAATAAKLKNAKAELAAARRVALVSGDSSGEAAAQLAKVSEQKAALAKKLEVKGAAAREAEDRCTALAADVAAARTEAHSAATAAEEKDIDMAMLTQEKADVEASLGKVTEQKAAMAEKFQAKGAAVREVEERCAALAAEAATLKEEVAAKTAEAQANAEELAMAMKVMNDNTPRGQEDTVPKELHDEIVADMAAARAAHAELEAKHGAETEALRRHLNAAAAAVEDKDIDTAMLTQEKTEAEAALAKVTEQKAAMAEKFQAKGAAVREAEERCAALAAELVAATEEARGALNAVQEKDIDIAMLTQDKQDAVASLAKATADLTAKDEELGKAREMSESASAETSTMIATLQHGMQACAQEKDDAESVLAQVSTKLAEKADELLLAMEMAETTSRATVPKEQHDTLRTEMTAAAEEKDIDMAMLTQEKQDAEASLAKVTAELALKDEELGLAMEMAAKTSADTVPKELYEKAAADLAAAQASHSTELASVRTEAQAVQAAHDDAVTVAEEKEIAHTNGLRAEIMLAVTVAEEKEIEVAMLQQEKDDAEAKCTMAQASLAKVSADLAAKNEELAGKEEELTMAMEMVDGGEKVGEDLAAAQASLAKVSADLAAKEEELAAKGEELAMAMEMAEPGTAETVSTEVHEKVAVDLERARAEKTALSTELLAVRTEQTEKADEQEIEMATLQQEKDDAEAKSASLTVELESKVGLVEQLAAKEDELSMAMDMAAMLQSDDLEGVQEELAAAKTAQATAESEHAAASVSAKAILAEKEQEHSTKLAEVEAAGAAQVQEVTSRADALQKERADYASQATELTASLAAKESECKSAGDMAAVMASSLRQEHTQEKETLLASHADQIAELKMELEFATASTDEAGESAAKVADLEAKCATLMAEVAAKAAAFAEKEEELALVTEMASDAANAEVSPRAGDDSAAKIAELETALAGAEEAMDIELASSTELAEAKTVLEMKVQELQVELEFAGTEPAGAEPGGCDAKEKGEIEEKVAKAEAAAVKLRLENKDLQNQLQTAMEFMEADD